MHVLITRPEPDGASLKSRIEALGCEATLAPLIQIAVNRISESAFYGAAGVIATSRNALRALVASPALAAARPLPLYVVGPGSAALAHEVRFADVREGAGTAADLVPILLADWRRTAGRYVYLSGDVTACDLSGALQSHGMLIAPVIAYRSVAAKTLEPDVIELLRARKIDAVLLMSPRTAKVWKTLAAGIMTPLQVARIAHLCLSPAVAASVGQEPAKARVFVAEQPSLEAMMNLVKNLAG